MQENGLSADLLLQGENSMNSKERIMKLSNAAKAITIVALFAIALTSAPAAKADDKGCSNATLRGTYSDQDTGNIIGVGPFAGVNVDSFDGNGNITISGMSSMNGNVSQGTLTGNYQVNSDCTGTYSVAQGTITAFFVIGQDGNELQIVITSPGTVINCVARKQFREHHG